MALTVEDGTGLANADALISVAYADAYHLALGNSTWTGADALKEAAIRRASLVLSRAYVWAGFPRRGRDQSLAWPRSGLVDPHGYGIPFDALPREIQEATAELALRELVDPGSLLPDFSYGAVVKSERIGPIGVEYANYAMTAGQSRPSIQIVDMLIAPFLASPASGYSGRAARG